MTSPGAGGRESQQSARPASTRPRGCVLGPWGSAVLDLVIAQDCAGCGAPGQLWCPGCRAGVARPPRVSDVPGLGRVVSAAPHDGAAGRAVSAFKDGGRRGLAAPLGRMLATAVAAGLLATDWCGEPVTLVPIPARPGARRRRGGDTMSQLAGRAARELRRAGVPARRCPLLVHARASSDQVGLGRAARRANMTGAFQGSGRGLPLGRVVVVDDVLTTGATLAAAVAAIRGSVPAVPATGRSPRARVQAATITVAAIGGASRASGVPGH